jgi:hypothetical protein
MAYGDTFSSVQDAALREKSMRDQNINAAFSRMMAVKQLNAQVDLQQQQLALEHEKLKASVMTAAMAHEQAQRHNDILEKQVNGYLNLQTRQIDKNFETDDHMGQALTDNLHESTTATTESEKNFELAKKVFNETQDRAAEMQRQGFITFDKNLGRYRGIPDKTGANDTNKIADEANQRLMQRKADLDEAQRKYEYDAKHHAHIIDVSSAKGFLYNGKTGELVDMQRGKKIQAHWLRNANQFWLCDNQRGPDKRRHRIQHRRRLYFADQRPRLDRQQTIDGLHQPRGQSVSREQAPVVSPGPLSVAKSFRGSVPRHPEKQRFRSIDIRPGRNGQLALRTRRRNVRRVIVCQPPRAVIKPPHARLD